MKTFSKTVFRNKRKNERGRTNSIILKFKRLILRDKGSFLSPFISSQKIIKVLGFLLVLSFFVVSPSLASAATLYIDGDLSGDCSGNYSINGRDCSGSDGDAYNTVSGGIGTASAGDTINIREGTYSINAPINVSFSSEATTTIQAYNSEVVTLHKTTIRTALFWLSSDFVKNILFKDIKFTSVPYIIITGWTNHSGNVWKASLSEFPTQIRFDTTDGTSVGSIAAVDSANEYYYDSDADLIYVYSVGDPSTTYTSPGVNLADNYDATAIGSPSGSSDGNLITIDNCEFENFSHGGIKGSWRWHVKNSKFSNIGTDLYDHIIYNVGTQTEDNESIFEYNYFAGLTPGGGIKHNNPSDPDGSAYSITRYNVFNGLTGSERGIYGILLGGPNHKVYGNTIYGYTNGLQLFRGSAQNNIIKNNIISNNDQDFKIDTMGSTSFPINNTVESNYLGSSTKCSGCSDYTGSGGPDLTTLVDAPSNTHSTSPWTQFTYDFTVTGGGNMSFFNACGGGDSPSYGIWYLDDISVIPSGGGAEEVTNGGMEGAYVSGVAPNWIKAGTSTWSESTSIVHSGSSAQKVDLRSGCGQRIQQNILLTAGTYTLSGWAKRDSGEGTLPVYFPGGGGNTSFTIGTLGPSFLGTAPYSSVFDFKLDTTGTDFSLLTNVAQNLGTSHQLGFNSVFTTWPIGTINQNYFGNGWDLGAFVYNDASPNPELPSPTGYTKDNTRPTLNFKKATDSGSGIASYSVSLDSGKNRSFSTSGIPFSGNGSASYTWKDNDSVKVEFFNENDSDSANDEIRVYFKDLNNNELSEGKHTWTVTAYDAASNPTSQSVDFYIDKTSPPISELAIANVAIVSADTSYNLGITNRMPSFSGLAIDSYQGSTVTNSNGTKDTFDKVSSGLQTLTLNLKKLDDGQDESLSDATYTDYLTEDYSLSNIQDDADDKKSSRFYITTPYPLVDGYYQVNLSLKDGAGNVYNHSVFYLSLNYQKQAPVGGLLSQGRLETKIIEEKKIPAETEEEKGQGFTVQVKVVDKNKEVVEGAKVELHSEPKLAYTNDQGIATFNNVEPGEHTIKIAYDGYSGEEKVKLEGEEIKEFDFTIQVSKQNPFLNPLVILAIGIPVVISIILLIKVRRQKKKV